MTTISCRCSSVAIRLNSVSPRVSTECCCDHCFARVKYLVGRGGPSIPSINKPLVNSKWDNAFVVEKGRELLFAYKMTKETGVYNIASTCCFTFLFGRNDQYDANCVTTCDCFPLFDDSFEKIEASSRWFSNQWSSERLSKLPNLIGIWVNDDGSLLGDNGWESVFAKMQSAMNSDIKIRNDFKASVESFDQLIQAIGNVIIVTSTEKDSEHER